MTAKRKNNPGIDARLQENTDKLLHSQSYVKAYEDEQFMQGEDARELRLLSEYLKADAAFNHRNIFSTIIVFGSARILSPEKANALLDEAKKELASDPESVRARQKVNAAQEKVEMSHYYEEARQFAKIVSEHNQFYDFNAGHQGPQHLDFVICTGGGPGIMEAANRGAFEAGGISIGLNISLPHEQEPNPYITHDLCFQYHYFAIRKLHFMMRARALVVFPGGFGTFDELFEGLTLRQCGRMQALPIIIFGKEFWSKCINFDYLVESGVISPGDLDLFTYVETAQEAWDAIREFYVKQD